MIGSMPARLPIACAATSCRNATWHRLRFGTDAEPCLPPPAGAPDGADEESHLRPADGNRSEPLRALTQADAAAHLAGEDEEMAKWLSGGRSTAATVQTAIDKFEEQWRSGGPRRAFGVFDCSKDQLIGFVEANLELLGNPAEVNVSYGIFFPW